MIQLRFDPCSMFIAGAIGYVLAKSAADALPRLQPALRFAGLIGVLGGGAWAYTECAPAKPFEVVNVVVFAVVAGELSVLAAAAALIPQLWMWDQWQRIAADGHAEREQRVDAARRRHERRCRISQTADLDETELHAALERSRQIYLKDINEYFT